MSNKSRSHHVLELAQELLDDLELSRAKPENLILKASRLARWAGGEEIRSWLTMELVGYSGSGKVTTRYMTLTKRWTDKEKRRGYWGPLAELEVTIEAERARLSAMRIPDTSGDMAAAATAGITRQMSSAANYIARLGGIRSRVLGLLHTFVSEVYYGRKFEGVAESVFDQYREEVDMRIAADCSEVLDRLPSVMDRLSEDEPESHAQALASCRRILDAFADSMSPPREGTERVGENDLKVGAANHLNRLNALVDSYEQSTGRKKKIRQNLANLYGRLSAGVHSDVSSAEARSLFLNTYLLLGEVLQIVGGESNSALQKDRRTGFRPAAERGVR